MSGWLLLYCLLLPYDTPVGITLPVILLVGVILEDRPTPFQRA